MQYYSADFETTTNPDDCRVWAYAFCSIASPEEVEVGNSIDDFMERVFSLGGVFYFHNLKFDGNFILYWLFKHGYKHSNSSKKMEPGMFNTLISDMGTWYTIKLVSFPNENGVTTDVEFRDSLKLIPLPVSDIPAAYDLSEEKLEIDYKEDRPVGNLLTPEEIEYVSHDVIIVAKAIAFMRENKQVKMTAASNALFDFKNRFSSKEWKRLFPQLNVIADRDIRKSYKGGWTYLNPKYKNATTGEGQVFDVNSMYPWAMKYCILPYGDPFFFSGKYKENSNYPLYVVSFVAEFSLKPGKYPSIQLKHTIGYSDNEYIVKSLKPEELTLTSVDLELFFENYDVEVLQWNGGFMFAGKVGMFSEYIDYWYDVKSTSKKEGNSGMEKIAKLMLNSLYGKFGARIDGRSKIPWYDASEDKVRYKRSELESRKGVYLPVATFITSYCRDKIIRTANLCGERFCYADTDSVHIVGLEPVPGMDVDKFRLGAFKQEEVFKRAIFIRQKTYMEIYEKGGEELINLKCCGMPSKMKDSITEAEFYEGAEYTPDKYAPKLVPKVVSGGVILKETSFKIKPTTIKEGIVIV